MGYGDYARETKNYYRVRMFSPKDCKKDTYGISNISVSEGIKGVVCVPKGKTGSRVQSFMFPKDKFSRGEALKWVKRHKGKK